MPTTTTDTTTNAASPPYDSLDEPPPYTPRADSLVGETTVEFGPSRPFQRPPPQPELTPAPTPPPPQPNFLVTPQPTGRRRSTGGGLLRQLQGQIEQIATQIERQATGMADRYTTPSMNSYSHSTYPGRPSLPPRNVPPASNSSSTLHPPTRHVSSASSRSLPEDSSDFSRDFYAAGTGDGMLNSESDGHQTPRNGTAPSGHSSNERGPTTAPTPGRPLLYQGQLLVYPKGHTCQKCHNTGYKHYDPLHPCKKCWSKYAKPFSGPLVYSYSSAPDTSNTHNTNLQKPLPLSASEPSPSNRRAVPPPLPPRRASFSQYGDNPQYAPYVRGPAPTPISGWAPPPPGSVVFRPGDPRIGGMLCWLCHGKGTKNIFIDVINCPACDGCGRTFA